MSDVEQVIRTVLTKEFKVEEARIEFEATFKQLGLDSLDVVSFVMALEDRLSIEIGESELSGVETYGAAVALLESKVGASA